MREHFATFLSNSINVSLNIAENRHDQSLEEYIETLDAESEEEKQCLKDTLSLIAMIKDLDNNIIYRKAPDNDSPIFPHEGRGLFIPKQALDCYCNNNLYCDSHIELFNTLHTTVKNNYTNNSLISSNMKTTLRNIINTGNYNQELKNDTNEFLDNTIDLFWLMGTPDYEHKYKTLLTYRKLITIMMNMEDLSFYKVMNMKMEVYKLANIFVDMDIIITD